MEHHRPGDASRTLDISTPAQARDGGVRHWSLITSKSARHSSHLADLYQLSMGPSGLAPGPQSKVHTASTAVSPSPGLPDADGTLFMALLGLLAKLLILVFRIIPGTLYWLVTFTSITLPTWLFTLFSTSLTFTMNATTLYGQPNH